MIELDPERDALSIRDGNLFLDGARVADIADRFGTPVYAISEMQLRRNARRFVRALSGAWANGPVRVLPSFKANLSLALRTILTQEGTGCDTFGPSELYAALMAGVPPGLISVNGSSKNRALIEHAVTVGARITLDSAEEIDLVRDVSRALGRRATVRFRVRPKYTDLEAPSDFFEEALPVREAAQEYKPGIPTEELIVAGRDALRARELDVAGVMAHLGRHRADLETWKGMVRAYVEVVAELSRGWGDWVPREIDVGGGFATPRDPTGRQTTRGRMRPPTERAPEIEEYATTIASTLDAELRRQGVSPSGIALEVEPGRSLYADAGIHVATVRHVKSQRGPPEWRWVETDTTEMFLLDGLLEHCRWTPIVVEKADRPATDRADITGISCGFDVIVRQASLPAVVPGDRIAFLDTGAYQDACANNFNGLPRPATVLVHGAEVELIKRAEDVEDVFRRDVVPERLRGIPAG